MLGIILESAIKVYYIMRKLLHIAIVLAKCDNFFTKRRINVTKENKNNYKNYFWVGISLQAVELKF